MNEASASIKINKLLEVAVWRFFADGKRAANVQLEPKVGISSTQLDEKGNDFEKTEKGLVDEIQTHSTWVIKRFYENFLASSSDDQERKYPDASDQIREILVHGHYLSQSALEICLAYAPSTLMKRPEFTRDNMRAIDALHQSILDEYKPKDD